MENDEYEPMFLKRNVIRKRGFDSTGVSVP